MTEQITIQPADLNLTDPCGNCIDRVRDSITSNEFVEIDLDVLTCDNCDELVDDCLCAICDWCSEPTLEGDISLIDNAYTCRNCYDDNFTGCDNCGEPTPNEYITYCYECSHEVCSYCAEELNCDYGHEDYGYDGQPEGVHDCYYKPSPIFHWVSHRGQFANTYNQSNKGEKANTKLFLGVELETEHQDGGITQGNIENIAHEVYHSGGENFAYLKEDGSITGVEIVTHPATLEFHKTTGLWDDIFNAIDDDGLYDSDGAGIHVHVSRAGLGDTVERREQVGTNALALLELHWDEWIKIARRVSGQWAPKNCGAVDLKDTPEDRVAEVLDYGKGNGKYSALNFSPSNTIEFRLFRSTTSREELTACLEAVQLIVELAQEWDIREVLTTPFSRVLGEAEVRGYEDFVNLWLSK